MLYYVTAFFAVASSFMIAKWGDGIRVPKELFCILGFLAIYLFASTADRRRGFTNKWIIGFVLWTFIQIAFYSQDRSGFYEGFYVVSAFLAVSALASAQSFSVIPIIRLRFAFLTFPEFTVDKYVDGFLRLLCWMSVAMSCYVFIQVLAWDSIHLVKGYWFGGDGDVTHRTIGTLGNPAVLASWYAMTLPAFFAQKGKLMKILFLFSFAMCCITKSAMGVAATVFAILVILLYRNKKFFWFLSIICLSIGLLFIYHPKLKTYVNPHGRIKAWKILYTAWHRGFEHPDHLNDPQGRKFIVRSGSLFGYGPGKSAEIFPKLTEWKVISSTPWIQAHNEPFEIAFNYGTVGLVLYLGFCGSILWTFLIVPKKKEMVALFGSLAGFFVSSLVLFPMHIGATAYLAVINVGMLLNIFYKTKEEGYEIPQSIRGRIMRALTMR